MSAGTVILVGAGNGSCIAFIRSTCHLNAVNISGILSTANGNSSFVSSVAVFSVAASGVVVAACALAESVRSMAASASSAVFVPVLAAAPYLTPTFTQFPAPDAPVAVFGERADIVLLTATVDESTINGGGSAVLDVAWQPLQPITFDYNIFFQALRANPSGNGYDVVAQLDAQPLPDRPPTLWQPGEIFTATYTLDLPVDPAAVNLRYYYGFYDWRDGSRPLLNRGDDKVILYGE